MGEDFPAALRGWRSRRRLSQLELAARAGTTQRHVSFLERGRSAPGRPLVVRLAEALEVPLRERNQLLLTAGYAPAYADAPLGDARYAAVRDALERVLRGHLPYPAMVVDRYARLVSANRAFWTLTGDAAPELRQEPVNVARLLLDPRGLAPAIVNFAEWARHVVDAMRRQADHTPDPALDELVASLEPLVPPAAERLGPDHVGFAVPLRLRRGDGELRLMTTLAHFGTAVDVAVSELRLEAFLPADDATAELLADLDRAAASRLRQ
ncbi:helix-turn-helix transcriptional regulator [Asanoa sp. NPDC050611]|uniref:helix-turn-helix transcriptional regulator n=1 Tax=Asanoa sp. NPDC050611 TaxID=3157098 RepID=UPI0033D50E2C